MANYNNGVVWALRADVVNALKSTTLFDEEWILQHFSPHKTKKERRKAAVFYDCLRKNKIFNDKDS